MKKFLALALVFCMIFTLAACGQKKEEEKKEEEGPKDYSGYTIRVYSNTNDESEVAWLKSHAEEAGFTISIDDNTVISGDTTVIQAANEGKDGDVLKQMPAGGGCRRGGFCRSGLGLYLDARAGALDSTLDRGFEPAVLEVVATSGQAGRAGMAPVRG